MWVIPGACTPRVERHKRLAHNIASDVSLASVVAARAAWGQRVSERARPGARYHLHFIGPSSAACLSPCSCVEAWCVACARRACTRPWNACCGEPRHSTCKGGARKSAAAPPSLKSLHCPLSLDWRLDGGMGMGRVSALDKGDWLIVSAAGAGQAPPRLANWGSTPVEQDSWWW